MFSRSIRPPAACCRSGLETTLPTGPSQFAGAKYIQGIHSTEMQPFLGYLLIRNRFYLHGFLSLSVPSSIRDVTMVYNDLGIGYFVFRSTDPDSCLDERRPDLRGACQLAADSSRLVQCQRSRRDGRRRGPDLRV